MSEGQTPTNPAAELVAVVEDLVERQRQILGALVTGRPPSRDSVQAVLLGMRGVVTKLRNGAAEADTPDAVERVAAAMWPGPPEWGSPVLESLGHAEQYRRMARAAITALRSPGPAATARAFQNAENARDNQLPTWDQLSPHSKAGRVVEAGRWLAALRPSVSDKDQS